VHPGAEDVPYDGVDQDCSGDDLDDVDGDGVASAAAGGEDCDDEEAGVFPGADETWSDGFTDNDCDGELEGAQLDFGASCWTGESAGGQLGRRVAALGDADGDGRAEYLASAILESSRFANGGAVYLLQGTASGSVAGAAGLWAGGGELVLGERTERGPGRRRGRRTRFCGVRLGVRGRRREDVGDQRSRAPRCGGA
jgi:hypothetical protein